MESIFNLLCILKFLEFIAYLSLCFFFTYQLVRKKLIKLAIKFKPLFKQNEINQNTYKKVVKIITYSFKGKQELALLRFNLWMWTQKENLTQDNFYKAAIILFKISFLKSIYGN